MTVIDSTPTLREFALMRLSALAKTRANHVKARRESISSNIFLPLIRVVLHLAGFGLLTIAGFEWSMIAGWCVAGISCFVLSTLLTPEAPDRR